MNPANPPTRYAGWTRWPAVVILAVTLAAICWCLRAALTRVTLPTEQHKGDRDVDLFRHVVQRVHAGEGYYDAFESEFKKYDYPVRSVFNYRTPVWAWVIGKLPRPACGQAILAVIAVATMLLAYTAMGRDAGPIRAVLGVMLMAGALAWCLVDRMFLYTEVWSGTLIALSVYAYAHGRRELGVAAGLVALFFRELALPYCVCAVALAWRQGRRREVAAWIAALALYGLFMMFHARAVAPRITRAGDLMNLSTWIRFGGTAFVLGTCRMNLFLVAAPAWVAAIYLPLAVLGLAGWRGDTGTRSGLVVAAYLAIFAAVGNPFNAYWGLMDAALLPFGVVWAPAAVRDLCRAILPIRGPVGREGRSLLPKLP